jgi:predicted dehydrogenase
MSFRIGLIGYGGIGRIHALGYRAIPFYYALPHDAIQVAAVATTRAETAEVAAREIGCDSWTADYRELFTRQDIDAIDCCTPNDSHEKVLVAAARAGKHIYCDKPLSMGIADGQRIVAAARGANILGGMTFNVRFYPAMQRAKQLMEEGFVGRIFSFRGRYYRSSYIDPLKPTSWRLSRERSGGGALLDLGAHVLDLLYYLLGDFASVQATLDTLIKERPAAAGSSERIPVDVDDIALLHARTADGTLGLVEISRMGTGKTNELIVEIFGEKGSIRFDATDPGWLEIYDVRDPDKPMGGMRGVRRVETMGRYDGARAPDWTMVPDFVRSHAECQYQFYKAVSAGRSPVPSLEDGLHIQAVMAAAERSSREGRWVRVDEVMPAFP